MEREREGAVVYLRPYEGRREGVVGVLTCRRGCEEESPLYVRKRHQTLHIIFSKPRLITPDNPLSSLKQPPLRAAITPAAHTNTPLTARSA